MLSTLGFDFIGPMPELAGINTEPASTKTRSYESDTYTGFERPHTDTLRRSGSFLATLFP
jgi:hypothetical protein